ncbi:iron-sulfur cluster assembly protein [Anaeromyxobacter sp. PSR-1]|uniref:iron-sulfur cluster assembly protein n=1 Tax=Anaeromyxobacter sp. PSR-1 TaxID=1300915 RepID=UPI0005DDFE8B|nr:iron-sulfur cluster assembly protein [Anaeromyxobacter sp. PSR-1]GAO01260.1 MIP18 family protein YitW [Anaeromyxobacter sp. PSR-1]
MDFGSTRSLAVRDVERASADPPFDERRIWEALGTVYDPEIPVSIVELGLVYDVATEPTEGGHAVRVKMTLTAPACPIGPVLVDDVRRAVLCLASVKEVDVEVVLEPPWDPSRMSEVARLQLGFTAADVP